jgi:AraC-like DNA-binding protein
MDARVTAAGIATDPYANEPLRPAIDVSTSSVPPAEQFDFYRSWFVGVAEMQLLRGEQSRFPARHQVWQLGDLALSSIEIPGSGYEVRWEHRRRPLLDHWMLSVPFSQSAAGEMTSRQPRMRCLALPDVGVSNDDLFITLFLPRTWPATRSSKIEAGDAALDFLAHYAILLHRSLPHLKESDLPHIVAATANLSAAALMPTKDNLAEAQGPVNVVSAARIAKGIADRLTDPDLTPGKLCRAVGVSRSRLYRIFEPVGGVSNYVRRKRLLKTRDALADSSDRRTISTIAEASGFHDPSTYSRMFKAEFGISPKEARELGWQGVKHSAWLTVDQPAEDVGILSNLLINNSLGLSLTSSR